MPPQDVGGRYSLPLAPGTSSNRPVRTVEGEDGIARAPAPATHSHISGASAREASMRAVAALAAEHGFDGANASALHVLADAMGRFMRQVAGMAQESYAEASHRPQPVLQDGVAALWDVGGPLAPPQLKLFAQKRGANPVRSDQSLRGNPAPTRARHPAPVPLLVASPPRPSWADPTLGFLTAEGDLEPEPPVQPDREDVPIPGRVGAFKSAVLPHPPLPPGYTYRAPEDNGEATSFAGKGPSSALVAVEKAWTKSQLTQASLKSLIRRIDAATQGVPFQEEDNDASALAGAAAPAGPAGPAAPTSASTTSLPPASARTPGSGPASSFGYPVHAPALSTKAEPEGETPMDLDSSPLPHPHAPPQADDESRRKRMRLSLSGASGLGSEGARASDPGAFGHVAPVPAATRGAARPGLAITVPGSPVGLSMPMSAPVAALKKSPFAFPPPSPVSRTFIRAWQEAHPSSPSTPAHAQAATPAPDLDTFTLSSLPGVVNFKSTWFAPRVRPRPQAR